jgi:hypothetical protein
MCHVLPCALAAEALKGKAHGQDACAYNRPIAADIVADKPVGYSAANSKVK